METYVKYCHDNANGTTGVVAVAQLSGPLTADVMKQGLTSLQKRHPVLRAFLSDSDEKHDYLEIDDEPAIVPVDIELVQKAGFVNVEIVKERSFQKLEIGNNSGEEIKCIQVRLLRSDNKYRERGKQL